MKAHVHDDSRNEKGLTMNSYWTKRKFVVATGVILVSAVAVASASDRPRLWEGAPTANPSRPLAQAVQADQRAGFAVFNRPRTSRDEMPVAAREQVGNSSQSGRNVELSRAIATPAGVGWAIPGNQTVCLAVPDPVDGYGIACSETGRAVTHGHMVMMIASNQPDVALITMLAPVGSQVAAVLKDGRRQPLDADSDGVISTTLVGATGISVETVAGTQYRRMPVAPPTAPSRG